MKKSPSYPVKTNDNTESLPPKLAEQVTEFHIELIRRKLLHSGLSMQDRKQIVDGIAERLKQDLQR